MSFSLSLLSSTVGWFDSDARCCLLLRNSTNDLQREEAKGGRYRNRKTSASTNVATQVLGAIETLNNDKFTLLWTEKSDGIRSATRRVVGKACVRCRRPAEG